MGNEKSSPHLLVLYMLGTLISVTKYNGTAFLGVNMKCGVVEVKA